METFIIGCVVAILVLIALIIYGAVSSSKKRESIDKASFHIFQGYDEILEEPYLYTPEKEGYLFGERKDTAQDVLLKQQIPINKEIDIVDKTTNESKTETISRIKKHYLPSLDVSGTCMVYKIYFAAYEGTELPCSFEVIKNDYIDTITFSNQEVVLIKDNVTQKSYRFNELKGRYYNNFLMLSHEDNHLDQKKETFYINPGSGNAFDNTVAPDKYYLNNQDFKKAQHLMWKYIKCDENN